MKPINKNNIKNSQVFQNETPEPKNIQIPTINPPEIDFPVNTQNIKHVINIQKRWRSFKARRLVEDKKMEMQMQQFYKQEDVLRDAFKVLFSVHLKEVVLDFLRKRRKKLVRICKYIRRYRFVQTIRRNIFKKRVKKVNNL
jgi:hypothetical protein